MKAPKMVIKVSKALSKKGKLKGKNKKETKMLKNLYPFHKLNKKGKVVPTTFIKDGYSICTVSGKKFPAKFIEKDDVAERINAVEELVNQAKFFSVATNSGNDMVDFFCEFAVGLAAFRKNFKKINKVASKQNSFKDKKKKKDRTGSASYGSWNINNK